MPVRPIATALHASQHVSFSALCVTRVSKLSLTRVHDVVCHCMMGCVGIIPRLVHSIFERIQVTGLALHVSLKHHTRHLEHHTCP